MKYKGLLTGEHSLKKNSKLIEAINNLPDGTIEGLSDYCPSWLFFRKNKVIIKNESNTPLQVNFPDGSTNNISKYGVSYFRYNGNDYEVIQ